MSFYSDVCSVHEEYRQICFPWASSWSAWKMRLRKFVMLTVFMWNCRTKGGERDLRTVGRSFDLKLHPSSRWRAVCTVFAGQLQYGDVVLFILYRYERKLPWFVNNWVRSKLGHRVRESLWKMVGMYSLVCEAFSDFTYISFQILCSGLPEFAYFDIWGFYRRQWWWCNSLLFWSDSLPSRFPSGLHGLWPSGRLSRWSFLV